MADIHWLGKGHNAGCDCAHCHFNGQQVESSGDRLQAIKERLKYYNFNTMQQEEDFIELMIMVEKLKDKQSTTS